MGKVGRIVLEEYAERVTGADNVAFGHKSRDKECGHYADGLADVIQEKFYNCIHKMRQGVIKDAKRIIGISIETSIEIREDEFLRPLYEQLDNDGD